MLAYRNKSFCANLHDFFSLGMVDFDLAKWNEIVKFRMELLSF